MCGVSQLDAYLREASTARALASAVGVSDVTVSQWRSRQKVPSPAMAVDVERATSGVVRRWDLRPDDWWRIWPELIGQPDAPAVPATEGGAR